MVVFWPQRGRNRAMRDTKTRVAERGKFDRDRLSNAKRANAADRPDRVVEMKYWQISAAMTFTRKSLDLPRRRAGFTLR